MDDREARRKAYEQRLEGDVRIGATGPRDVDRWKQTLAFLPRDVESVLDCGCDVGHWLDYVRRHRRLARCTGVDIAENRIAEARRLYPHIEFRAGYAEELLQLGEAFDAVTSLEVLEHIPEWEQVLRAMLQLARKVVLVTVPYKEEIVQTACIHCGRLTPLYGHLRRYDETSFKAEPGWRLEFGYILNRGVAEPTVIRRIYRRLFPRRSWLVARYTRVRLPDERRPPAPPDAARSSR
ncbi:MAG: class I SAM-dependent methyltransferase [Planctomycetota bacterium]|nr:class I SAM-dependent methyltransferase [Planctomycetota bacterium]